MLSGFSRSVQGLGAAFQEVLSSGKEVFKGLDGIIPNQVSVLVFLLRSIKARYRGGEVCFQRGVGYIKTKPATYLKYQSI